MSNTASKLMLFLIIFATKSYEIGTEPHSKILSNKTNDKLTVYQEDEDDKSSLVFVFDTTGSMHNDLKQLREGAEMILNTALEESDVIADFVLVPFHDPAVGPVTVTKDKEVFKSALNIIRVYGGGDCPEKSLSGIQLALNASRPGSHVYVFTDATASDHRLVGKVLDAVQRKQSQVVFVLTGHCNDLHRPSYKVYQQIAAASSGQVFNLNKTNVHKVLDFVRSSVKGRTVNLDSSVNPPGYNHSQGIPIDSMLNEVTVSISGSKPQVKVVNPRGEEISGPPQLITTLDLAEIVIVKVLQPEPGNWTITTGSEDSYSVKVVGTSNLTFSHGFSVSKPGSMAETSHRPLQGTYNHLMIALTQTERPVQMNYAEIQSLNGTSLFEIPLKEIDKDKKIYLTEPFLPPDDFFYVAINGRDEYNQDLRRIGATAIQAKPPDVPYLTVPQKIEARIHDRVVLKCKVESLVPVTVFWNKEGESSSQDKVSSLQSTTVDFVIEDLNQGSAGKYRCVAMNVAGVSTSYSTVDMLVEPPLLIIEPVNKTVQIGSTFDIICTAKSDSVLTKFDLYFNGVKIELEYEIKFIEESYIASKHQAFNNVTEENSGIYTCIVENKGGGESTISTTITVQSNPIAQIIGPHTITKPIHSTIQLVCRIESADHVVWTFNNSVVRKFGVNGSAIEMYDVEDVSEDGVWSCMAVRGARIATDSVAITVLIKPEVLIEGDKNVAVLYGSIHNISCLIRAKPQPRILWHRETEDFLNNTITLASPNLYKSHLILNSSRESVNGTYFCIGENSEGIGQDNVVVTVRRPMMLLQGFTDTEVNLYSQVELQCRIEGFPTPRVQWYHNNTYLRTNENLRLSEDNSTLYILRVGFRELGLYSCEADNDFEKLRVDGSLIAKDLERPVLQKDITQITTHKGNSTKITCRIIKGKPKPAITWQYKSNTSDIFTTLPSNVIWSGNSELDILNVQANDSGIYRCFGENALGSDFHDIALRVLYPPEFIQSEKEKDDKPVEVKEGERVTFSCHAIGFPPPIVVWTKNNQPIAYSKNVYLTDEHELVISKANEYDTGFYTCDVTSVLATLQRNFTLVVYSPPTMIPPDFEPVAEVLEGQLVELPCRARGNPKPEVSWLQNGQVVTEDRKYIDEFGLRFVANLTDFGEYVCIARSKYGSSSVNYTIFIWVPPYIEPPPKSTINSLVGANATLTCDATGFPVPTIVWEFQGKILTENTTDLSYNDIGNIYINNASSKHDGIYTCIAENFVGIARKDIILNVNEQPKILNDNFSGYYVGTNKDTALALSCRTAGKPKPFVAWVKDDLHYLDKDTRYDIDIYGTLTIKAPSEELSGLYTCVAKNFVGSANRTVNVKIYPLLQRMQADESQSTITVLEGTNTNLKCPKQASDDDTVKWYKNAKLISEGYLQIQNITRKNSSIYACVVTNAVASSHSTVHIHVEWPPVFIECENLNDSVEVVKGDDWYFDCEVDANPKAQTQWLFNSKHLVSEKKERLKLMNVELYHTGVYKCVVSNIHGTIARQFVLNVLEPPYISDFGFLDVQLNEGANATLECNAKGSPTPEVKWTFNNTNWHLVNTTLTSNNVTTAFEGLFACIATNKAGSARLVYQVLVIVQARVEDVVIYRVGGGGESVVGGVQVPTGTHLRISCVATGNPVAKIQWIKNGLTIAQNGKNISYTDLIFDHVETKNTGLYSCVAVNEGGIDQRNIKLDVLEPPKILQYPFLNSNNLTNVTNMDVITGQPFFLHCHPYGNPAPSLYWFRDDQPLRFFDNTMVSIDYGEVIEVKSAEIGQSANYTCVAKNIVGEASIVYLVNVLVPPLTVKETTKITTTRVTRSLNLTCPVQGSPLPIVTWIKQPYSELSGGRIQFLNNNFTLFINNTEVQDSGKYSCIMTNKVGSSEVAFNVIVEKPPYIAGNVQERYLVLLGRSIVLKCQAGGNPTPKVVWLKDNQKLAEHVHPIPEGSAVVIWTVSSVHAGQYVCVAVNDAGAARARHDVIVQVPGKWSSWSQWSLCNVTCGLGYQIRSRSCRHFDYHNATYDSTSEYLILDKSSCKGALNERRRCHMPACEDNESQRWSPWSKWSKCSASCGVGTQVRSRRCLSTTPCAGDNVQLRKCPNLPTCNNEETFENEVSSGETLNYSSPFIPEAVFEIQPDIVNPEQTQDVEEVYIKQDLKLTSAVYEVKVSENLDGSDRGPCDPGFKVNSTTQQCEDIDECLVDTNQCHSSQLCMNTPGAYSCACAPGFASLGAGQRCLDINECAVGAHGCAQACVNAAGGYACACAPPRRLAPDRRACVLPSSSYSSYGDLDVGEEDLNSPVEFPLLAKYKSYYRQY